ncbi:MAG: MlaD family protein [Desulfobacteraceae bacterium]|jgi:paraquat-inducible protein B|nr:MlaD family protein [Desulfobacteraceae bacterium]
MAKQWNKTVIGAFVMSGIVLLIVSVILFGGGRFFVERHRFVLFFQGSIRGLAAGAPVVLQGVQVGSVERIFLQEDPESGSLRIPVIISLVPDQIDTGGVAIDDLDESIQNMIARGLKGQLMIQSLVTGQLVIELDFYPDLPVRLVGSDLPYPEIPTIPSSLEQIAKTLEKIPVQQLFEKLIGAIEGIERNINSPETQKALKALQQTALGAERLVNSADAVVAEAGHTLQNLDQQVGALGANLKTVTESAGRLLQQIDAQVAPLGQEARQTLDATRRLLAEAQNTVAGVDGFVGERSELRQRLNRSLEEISAAARALRSLSDLLERHPEVLLRGKRGLERR